MLEDEAIRLRPVRDEDWPTIERWASTRSSLWGPFQRHQLDNLPAIRDVYRRTGLLSRQGALLIIEPLTDPRPVGFVRYALQAYPDEDYPCADIGFGLAEPGSRGKGYTTRAVRLLLAYLHAGYATPRVSAVTDIDNDVAQHVLEGAGFHREGVLRAATFRDGEWHDLAVYAAIRERMPAG